MFYLTFSDLVEWFHVMHVASLPCHSSDIPPTCITKLRAQRTSEHKHTRDAPKGIHRLPDKPDRQSINRDLEIKLCLNMST